MAYGRVKPLVIEAGKVVVQPDGLRYVAWQVPGARDDGAHHGVVGAVAGVFGLGEGAVLARQGLGHGASIAAHRLHQHRHAHMAEQTEAVAQARVKAVELVADVFAGDGAALRAFPKVVEQR